MTVETDKKLEQSLNKLLDVVIIFRASLREPVLQKELRFRTRSVDE